MIDIYSKVKKASNEDGCEEKKGKREMKNWDLLILIRNRVLGRRKLEIYGGD